MAVMDQDTRWMTRYNEVMTFIESNHRNPSKYADEERRMLHFMKRGRQMMNAGKMKAERVEAFKKLLTLAAKNKHVNQYV